MSTTGGGRGGGRAAPVRPCRDGMDPPVKALTGQVAAG